MKTQLIKLLFSNNGIFLFAFTEDKTLEQIAEFLKETWKHWINKINLNEQWSCSIEVWNNSIRITGDEDFHEFNIETTIVH